MGSKMKLIAFEHVREQPPRRRRTGVLVSDRVLDLAPMSADSASHGRFDDLPSLMQSGSDGIAVLHRLVAGPAGQAWTSVADVRLLAPILPTTILCSGSNYHAHNREKAGSPDGGKNPEFFIKTADCVIGSGEQIPYDPEVTRKMDCETELAIVIGKAGRNIPVADALGHVFGYTIVNDVTARDRQVRRTAKGDVWYDLARGKVFDGSAPLGPCIVTADEIQDPQDLTIETRINGELRQAASTSDMIWSCAELIHNFSNQLTLRPGMVIITGSPAGTAWSNDPELGGQFTPQAGIVAATRYCQPGDVVESWISGIGILRNSVG